MKSLFVFLASSCLCHAVPPVTHTARIDGDTIIVTKVGTDQALLVQVAKADHRPYLHPITAPDGKGVLTEYSPGHHKHQTGLYWGFTRVNGRDYFHHPAEGYWKLKEKKVLPHQGPSVRWRTVYEMLDAEGKPLLVETQTWSLVPRGDKHYLLDLKWSGKAESDITFAKYNYGGLFLRMPWKRQAGGEAMNSKGDKNGQAEGKRANWVDIGMPIQGRDDWGHIVIMDHPKNDGHPIAWRVDGQLGVGPCRARLGEWKLAAGDTATFRHRLLVYTGKTDRPLAEKYWKYFSEKHLSE